MINLKFKSMSNLWREKENPLLFPGVFPVVDGHVSGHFRHVHLRNTHDLEAGFDLQKKNNYWKPKKKTIIGNWKDHFCAFLDFVIEVK